MAGQQVNSVTPVSFVPWPLTVRWCGCKFLYHNTIIGNICITKVAFSDGDMHVDTSYSCNLAGALYEALCLDTRVY